jgi:hypothetical protein
MLLRVDLIRGSMCATAKDIDEDKVDSRSARR